MRLLPLSGKFSLEGLVVAHRACFVAVERDFGAMGGSRRSMEFVAGH